MSECGRSARPRGGRRRGQASDFRRARARSYVGTGAASRRGRRATPGNSRRRRGPARVAAVSPRIRTVRALKDRDWSPMLPSTRVGLQRLVDGDVVRAFEGEKGEEGERGERGEKDAGNRPPFSSERSAVVASASELRVALGLPARGKPRREPTPRRSSETVKKLVQKPPHASRYAFGSSVETGRGGALAAAAEEAALRDDADATADFLRRGRAGPDRVSGARGAFGDSSGRG